MDHFSFCTPARFASGRGSSGSHAICLWNVGKISCKTPSEKVDIRKCRHWDIFRKDAKIPCFQEIRNLTIWYGPGCWNSGVRYFLPIFPKMAEHFTRNPGWWEMIIRRIHGNVATGSWAGRGRASATSDSSPTRCRGKGWVDFPLGHFRKHAAQNIVFRKFLNHVICVM